MFPEIQFNFSGLKDINKKLNIAYGFDKNMKYDEKKADYKKLKKYKKKNKNIWTNYRFVQKKNVKRMLKILKH